MCKNAPEHAHALNDSDFWSGNKFDLESVKVAASTKYH